jgi:sec-independent protein translocase protein TatB
MIDALWSELFIIILIALIFLGPKDLLILLKTIGKWVAKGQEMIQSLRMSIDYEAYMQDQHDKNKTPKKDGLHKKGDDQ